MHIIIVLFVGFNKFLASVVILVSYWGLITLVSLFRVGLSSYGVCYVSKLEVELSWNMF